MTRSPRRRSTTSRRCAGSRQLSVPRVADWCAIDYVRRRHAPSGRRAPRDPDKVQLVRELSERYPEDPRAEIGAYSAMRRGTLQWGEFSNELIDAVAKDAEHARILRTLALGHSIVAPLMGREGAIGAISFVSDDASRLDSPMRVGWSPRISADGQASRSRMRGCTRWCARARYGWRSRRLSWRRRPRSSRR